MVSPMWAHQTKLSVTSRKMWPCVNQFRTIAVATIGKSTHALAVALMASASKAARPSSQATANSSYSKAVMMAAAALAATAQEVSAMPNSCVKKKRRHAQRHTGGSDVGKGFCPGINEQDTGTLAPK